MDTQENNPTFEIKSYHTPEDFVEVMIAMCISAHCTAVEKGWWESDRNMGEIVSNFHAEISEFWESYRKPEREMSTQCEGFYNDEIELADLMIRVMDLAAAKDYRLAEAIVAKMEYNRTRPHRHGNKKA